MTFANMRRQAIRKTTLNTDRFAERVRYQDDSAADIEELTVKVEMDQRPRTQADSPVAKRQVDSDERIRVIISHDTDAEGGFIGGTPKIGANLWRSDTVDTDERPWSFQGETVARTPFCGTYIFVRARRQYDGRR